MASKSKRVATWSGVILDNGEDLLKWWAHTVGTDVLPKVFSHHMTIEFKPSNEEVASLPIGRKVELTIDGYAEDDKAQVVRVRGFSSSKPVPHVTVATDGASPVYANKLIQQGVTKVKPFILKGTVGYSDGRGDRFDYVKMAKHDPSRNPYQKEYQKNRYHERKSMAVKMLGGKCSVCGSKRNLELDHKDPSSKKFTITKLWSVPETEFKTEVRKCRLLCHKHHLENSAKQRERGVVKSIPGKSKYDSKNRRKANLHSQASLVIEAGQIKSSSDAAKTIAKAAADKYQVDVRKEFNRSEHVDKPFLTYGSYKTDDGRQVVITVYGRERDKDLVRKLVAAVKKRMSSSLSEFQYVNDLHEQGLLAFSLAGLL